MNIKIALIFPSIAILIFFLFMYEYDNGLNEPLSGRHSELKGPIEVPDIQKLNQHEVVDSGNSIDMNNRESNRNENESTIKSPLITETHIDNKLEQKQLEEKRKQLEEKVNQMRSDSVVLQKFLEEYGINFQKEGSRVRYVRTAGRIVMTNTREQDFLLQALLGNVNKKNFDQKNEESNEGKDELVTNFYSVDAKTFKILTELIEK